MKTKLMTLLLFATLIAGCQPYTPGPDTAQGGEQPAPFMAITPSPANTPSATPDLYADVHVSQTAVALESTRLSQQAQDIAANQAAVNIQLTIDAATSTGVSAVTQTAIQQQASTQTAIAFIPVLETAGASTAVSATKTAQIENQQYRAEVAGIWIGKFFISVLALLVLFGIGWLIVVGVRGLNFKLAQMEPDGNGRFKAVAHDAIPGKEKKLVNINLAHRAITGNDTDDLTAEQALTNAMDQRQLEATRAIATSLPIMRQIARQAVKQTQASLPDANLTISKPMAPLLSAGMPAPPWSMITNWDGKNGIPYGVSEQGMEFVQLSDVPHGGIFGKTGKGKSRYFLRPFIAGAIAAGHRVIIIGKQADFWPFANHPNVKMIAVRNITEAAEAERYAGYLKRVVMEMNRRDEELTSRRISVWDRENTLIVLDELGNAVDMMPREVAQDAKRWVQGLVKEGRKAGLNVWLASQRAVGFRGIVEQLGRAVFHLADAEASRIALGFAGAESLIDGHFFAKFNDVRECTSFDPTDDELAAFLRERSVPAYEPINWIEGQVVGEGKAESEQPVTETKAERDLRIWNMHLDGKSQADIERTVFGYKGGNAANAVSEVISRYKSATTTGNMPDSTPVAA
jgi:hypothetical protein